MKRLLMVALAAATGCSFVVAPLDPAVFPDAATMPDVFFEDLTPAQFSCIDGIKNGNETDIDCGGPTCKKCQLQQGCVDPKDCVTGACMGMTCVNGNCTDGLLNGNETDVDCGGGTCPLCDAGKMCMKATDCPANASCSNNKCTCNADFFGNQCIAPKSCRDLHAQDGALATGMATIDLDGAGPMPQMQVFCNMDPMKDGGGWTRLVTQNETMAGGYFGSAQAALSTVPDQPLAPLYSILGLVDSFQRNGAYEFLYWNRDHDKWVISTQTDSPLNMANAGRCPSGFVLGVSNFSPMFLCGYSPGPAGTATLSTNGANFVYTVAQLKAYFSYPLVCTFPDNEQCSWVEFYIR